MAADDQTTAIIGARVIDGMKIGARAFVTAGAVVTRDVEADTTVAGMPARRVRRLGPSETP